MSHGNSYNFILKFKIKLQLFGIKIIFLDLHMNIRFVEIDAQTNHGQVAKSVILNERMSHGNTYNFQAKF